MPAIAVLGPVQLHGPDGEVRLGSVRRRRLLAALVAHLDTGVGTGRLAELVWGHDAAAGPADPAGAVQTAVARLRRLLPPGVRIATTADGYRLDVDPATVDTVTFGDHLAAAAAAADPLRRLDRIEAALALWRGDPYLDLDDPALAPEVTRLTGLYAAAREQRAAALLDAGRAAEAVTALESLVAAEPLREGPVGLLMRALAVAGRQADALAAYTRLRSRLAGELGLDPSPQLRELEQRVLRHEVAPPPARAEPRPAQPAPPPAAPSPAGCAPPLPVSAFVGRADDLARVTALLGRFRVVTLCGPGGVGKTRLARHVVAAVAARYDDGALLVEFGEGGPADVLPALAGALRLADPGASGVVARIVEVLAVRRQLLVLDNCEHVADEVAPVVEAVSTGTARVDVLVTSREPLAVDGERVVPVAPLVAGAAAALLRDRIHAHGADADTGPDEPALVAALCRRLDGLPLALEIAAARVRALGLAGLLAALGGAGPDAAELPLDVLRGGRRTAAPRHRSLRGVVEWSLGLLDEPQRRLFERLAVFAGPVDPAAVAVVCGDAGPLPDLVDRSLVVRVPGEPARFGMLETLRAVGRSRLAADPAGAELRVRHALWAVALAEEVARGRRGPDEPAAVARFDAHLADLRRAHAWLCAHGPVEDLLRLSLPVAEFAYLRGRLDLTRMVEETLRAADGAAHPLVARLTGLLAATRWQRGALDEAEGLAREAQRLAAAVGDPLAAREGIEALANVCSFRGDLAGAVRHGRRALDLAEAAGAHETAFLALLDLTLAAVYGGDDEAAGRFETRLVEAARRIGSPSAHAFLAYGQGERRAARGDPGAARYLREAVAAAETAGSDFIAGVARHTLLTAAAREAPDPAAVLAGFGPLLDHWHALGAWTQLWMAVRGLVEAASRSGRHAETAVLLGAMAASPRAAPVFGADTARLSEVRGAARAALGAAYEQELARGAALGDAGALALARRLTRAGPPGDAAQDAPGGATPRRGCW